MSDAFAWQGPGPGLFRAMVRTVGNTDQVLVINAAAQTVQQGGPGIATVMAAEQVSLRWPVGRRTVGPKGQGLDGGRQGRYGRRG